MSSDRSSLKKAVVGVLAAGALATAASLRWLRARDKSAFPAGTLEPAIVDEDKDLTPEEKAARTAAKIEAVYQRKNTYEVVLETEIEPVVLTEYNTVSAVNGATIIVGFESLAANLAVSYLAETLDLPLVGAIDSDLFPALGVVANYRPATGCRIYGNSRIVVFASDFKFEEDAQTVNKSIVAAIYDFAERHHARAIVTLDTMVAKGAVNVDDYATQEELLGGILKNLNHEQGGDDEGDMDDGEEYEDDDDGSGGMGYELAGGLPGAGKKKTKRAKAQVAVSELAKDKPESADAKKDKNKPPVEEKKEPKVVDTTEKDKKDKKGSKADKDSKKPKARSRKDEEKDEEEDVDPEAVVHPGEIRFATNSVGLARRMKELQIKPAKDAQIGGVAGGLLSESITSTQDVIAILAARDPILPEHTAALPLIETLAKLLGKEVVINVKELTRRSKRMEGQIRKALTRMAPKANEGHHLPMYT